jgi:hypothetical protein
MDRRTVNKTVIVGGITSISIAIDDEYVEINVPVASVLMPSCTNKIGAVRIIGGSIGLFGQFNLIIRPTGSELFSGKPSITLDTDFQTVLLTPRSTGGYLVLP